MEHRSLLLTHYEWRWEAEEEAVVSRHVEVCGGLASLEGLEVWEIRATVTDIITKDHKN